MVCHAAGHELESFYFCASRALHSHTRPAQPRRDSPFIPSAPPRGFSIDHSIALVEMQQSFGNRTTTHHNQRHPLLTNATCTHASEPRVRACKRSHARTVRDNNSTATSIRKKKKKERKKALQHKHGIQFNWHDRPDKEKTSSAEEMIKDNRWCMHRGDESDETWRVDVGDMDMAMAQRPKVRVPFALNSPTLARAVTLRRIPFPLALSARLRSAWPRHRLVTGIYSLGASKSTSSFRPPTAGSGAVDASCHAPRARCSSHMSIKNTGHK